MTEQGNHFYIFLGAELLHKVRAIAAFKRDANCSFQNIRLPLNTRHPHPPGVSGSFLKVLGGYCQTDRPKDLKIFLLRDVFLVLQGSYASQLRKHWKEGPSYLDKKPTVRKAVPD